jgi:hypothetical protein
MVVRVKPTVIGGTQRGKGAKFDHGNSSVAGVCS